jgi:hypothetical protein
MRIFVVCLLVLSFGRGVLADNVPIDQLPEPVLATIKRKNSTGTIKTAEVFDWGGTKIYRVEIDLNGSPDQELEIAQDGKLVRSDSLKPEEPAEEDGQ